jgi:hypothetical protein
MWLFKKGDFQDDPSPPALERHCLFLCVSPGSLPQMGAGAMIAIHVENDYEKGISG